MRVSFILSFFSILVLANFVACKKDEIDNETQSVLDNALIESEFMRIPAMINFHAATNQGVHKIFPGVMSCYNVSLSGDTSWTNQNDLPTLTFDYGTGCTDADGRNRSGKISAAFSKSYDSIGCVITVSFNNFYSHGNKMEGAVQLTRLSSSSFNIKTTDAKYSIGSASIAFTCDRTITMIGGSTTINNESDDVFEITGSSSGMNRNGKRFEVKILTTLVKAASCKWLQSGKQELTPEGLATRTVDYGDGSCDNKATFGVNGNTFEFSMN
jgi:hypothetical protein